MIEIVQSKEIVNGFVSSTGFTNNDIYLEKINNALFNEINNSEQKEKESISQIRNYRDFVF